jgi:hypothetical protein|tara:strand:+ start:903 stop:1448 length:546 start_codon:yes stop_codon:yes gene_type:complete
MPGSIKIDDGSGNYTILTNAGSLGSDKTITIPNLTGTVGVPETGTWTSTIQYSTTLTTTSGFSTLTFTGNYFKIGNWYRCSLPRINRSSMSLSADFIVNSVSLPATTASTNQTVNGVYGYGLGAQYSSTVIAQPQIMAGCGGGSTTLSVQGLDTDAGGTGFVLVSYGTTGYLDLSWDFVAA